MSESHVVYEHPPVELVSAEIRFQYMPRLGTEETFSTLSERFADFSNVQREQRAEFAVVLPQGTSRLDNETAVRLMDESRTKSITLSAQRMTVETTDYLGWESFGELIGRAADELWRLAPVRIERLGLRYLDEIRSPDVTADVRSWTDWVRPGLLGAMSVLPDEAVPEQFQSVTVAQLPRDAAVIVRVGVFNGLGLVADGAPMARRRQEPEGPFFGIDTDCYWQPKGRLGKLGAPEAIAVFEELHGHQGTIFRSSIGDKLRNVLKEKQ